MPNFLAKTKWNSRSTIIYNPFFNTKKKKVPGILFFYLSKIILFWNDTVDYTRVNVTYLYIADNTHNKLVFGIFYKKKT